MIFIEYCKMSQKTSYSFTELIGIYAKRTAPFYSSSFKYHGYYYYFQKILDDGSALCGIGTLGVMQKAIDPGSECDFNSQERLLHYDSNGRKISLFTEIIPAIFNDGNWKPFNYDEPIDDDDDDKNFEGEVEKKSIGQTDSPSNGVLQLKLLYNIDNPKIKEPLIWMEHLKFTDRRECRMG